MSRTLLLFAVLALCLATAFSQRHHFEAFDEDFENILFDDDEGTGCTTTTALRVRASPSTSAKILGLVGAGGSVNKVGSEGAWAKVSYQGKTGYMHSDYLKCGAAPAPKTTTCRATTAVNVRAGASTSSAKLGLLQNGESVSKTGANGVWAKVNYKGKAGYVHSDYLNCGGSPAPTPSGSKCHRTQFPLYKQCDGRWGGDALGSRTICSIGCLMSSVSMALSGLGKKINGGAITPRTMNQWLRSHGGYSGNNFIWGSISPFGLSFQGKTSNHADIKSKVCNSGYIVILAVHNQGHYILATGVDNNGNYIVNDPGYAKSVYTPGEVNLGAIYRI